MPPTLPFPRRIVYSLFSESFGNTQTVVKLMGWVREKSIREGFEVITTSLRRSTVAWEMTFYNMCLLLFRGDAVQ